MSLCILGSVRHPHTEIGSWEESQPVRLPAKLHCMDLFYLILHYTETRLKLYKNIVEANKVLFKIKFTYQLLFLQKRPMIVSTYSPSEMIFWCRCAASGGDKWRSLFLTFPIWKVFYTHTKPCSPVLPQKVLICVCIIPPLLSLVCQVRAGGQPRSRYR